MNLLLNLPRHYYLRLLVGSEATPPKKSIPYPEKVTAVKEKPLGECFTLSRSGGAVLTSLRSDKTTTPLPYDREKQTSPSGFSFTAVTFPG